jgi:hypothetical protein
MIICLLLIAMNLLVISGGADNNDKIVITLSNFGPRWDINQDGIEDTYDISILVSHYGMSGPPSWIGADVNEDGYVDTYDASIEVTHYGQRWLS